MPPAAGGGDSPPKVIVVGSPGSGKSCLVRRLAKGEYPPDTDDPDAEALALLQDQLSGSPVPVDADPDADPVPVNKREAHVAMLHWRYGRAHPVRLVEAGDWVGHTARDLPDEARAAYGGAAAAVVVADLAAPGALSAALRWKHHLDDCRARGRGGAAPLLPAAAPALLCLAKCDLPESCAGGDGQGEQTAVLAAKHGFAACAAASARTGEGAAGLLRALLRLLVGDGAAAGAATGVLRDAAQGAAGGAPALTALCGLLGAEPDDPRAVPPPAEEWMGALRAPPPDVDALTAAEAEAGAAELASQLLCGGASVDEALLRQLFAAWDPTECGAIPKAAYREWWLRHVAPALGLDAAAAERRVDKALRPLRAANERSLAWAEFLMLMYGVARM